jgi:hypothetical protein
VVPLAHDLLLQVTFPSSEANLLTSKQLGSPYVHAIPLASVVFFFEKKIIVLASTSIDAYEFLLLYWSIKSYKNVASWVAQEPHESRVSETSLIKSYPNSHHSYFSLSHLERPLPCDSFHIDFVIASSVRPS